MRWRQRCRCVPTVIPPREIKDPPPKRGAIVQRITETAMFRVKILFSPSLKSRTTPNQKTKAAITVSCLNRFTALGMPVSVKIA